MSEEIPENNAYPTLRETEMVTLGMMAGMSCTAGAMYLMHIGGEVELAHLAPWMFVIPLILMFAVPITLRKVWEWGDRLEERWGSNA